MAVPLLYGSQVFSKHMLILPSGDSNLIEPPWYTDLAMSHTVFGRNSFKNSSIRDFSTAEAIGTADPRFVRRIRPYV